LCSSCSRQLPGKIRFCPHCGTPQAPPASCNQCGRRIPERLGYCPVCEDRQEHPVPARGDPTLPPPTRPLVPPDEPISAPPTPQDDYPCPHCGFRVSFQAKQCPICDQTLLICGVCHYPIFANHRAVRCPGCTWLFHVDHLREWLKIHGSCPTCQHRLQESALEPYPLGKEKEPSF
jgi:hypothetical protein